MQGREAGKKSMKVKKREVSQTEKERTLLLTREGSCEGGAATHHAA